MPRVTEEYREAKKTRIVEAALRAFGRSGFQATSMADIIAESGMSAGAIYAYFPGKADIIAEAAGRVLGGRIVDIERIARSDTVPPPAALVRAILSGIRAELGDVGIIVQVWGEAATDPKLHALAGSAFARLLEAFRHYLTAWHQREHGLQRETAEALAGQQAPLLLSACQGYIVQLALLDAFDSEFYLEHVTRNLPH